MHNEDLKRLADIRNEMFDLLEEASNIVRVANKSEYERAKACWIGNIDVGLGGGSYFDNYDYTMLKTLTNLGMCKDCASVPCTCDDAINCAICEETPCICDFDEDFADDVACSERIVGEVCASCGADKNEECKDND